MRLFVGIFPDDNTRAYLRDVRQQFAKLKRNLNFVPIDQLHMTLKFLGNNVSEQVLEYYLSTLKPLVEAVPKFEYNLQRMSFGFTHQVTPNVLMYQVEDNPHITELNNICTQAAKDLSKYQIINTKERKKLVNHITIARIKHDNSNAFNRTMHEFIVKFKSPEFKSKAENVSIVQSTITPKGPVYKSLLQIPLR